MHVLELTSNSWPHVQKKEGKRKKKLFFANGEFRAPSYGWRAIAGRQPALALSNYGFFFNIFLISFNFFGKFGEWAKPFGRMGVQHPHFLKLAPTLESVKSSIPHGA
jgi:hypothetical protein